MSKQDTPHQKEQSPIERLSAFIVDKWKAFYLVYIGVAIFCVFSSGWVSVNDDLTSYLPDTTETRQGLTIMDEEFVTFGTNRVMVDNITCQRAEELAAVLETLEGVKSVDFDNTEDHYQSGAALFDLTYGGTAEDQVSLNAEMQVVMVVAVVIILLVLLFTSHTYNDSQIAQETVEGTFRLTPRQFYVPLCL